jgi:hypothetical protein
MIKTVDDVKSKTFYRISLIQSDGEMSFVKKIIGISKAFKMFKDYQDILTHGKTEAQK